MLLPKHGKVTFTGLSGTVYDASGARVPDAVVAVSSLDAKIRKTVATDEEGSFRFEGLPEGRYQVEVSKPGFALYQQPLLKTSTVAGRKTG